MTPAILQRLEDRSAKIAVIGQGYVGLVVAMRASEAGFDVVGLEVDERRVKRLTIGDSYIEDGTSPTTFSRQHSIVAARPRQTHPPSKASTWP